MFLVRACECDRRTILLYSPTPDLNKSNAFEGINKNQSNMQTLHLGGCVHNSRKIACYLEISSVACTNRSKLYVRKSTYMEIAVVSID